MCVMPATDRRRIDPRDTMQNKTPVGYELRGL